MQTFVETYNQIEGFHRWPDAPKALAYLASRHRHLFVVRCSFLVEHEDRAIEINQMQNRIENYLRLKYGAPMELKNMSCEMLAHDLMEWGELDGITKVTVLEDNYGGATLTR